MTRSETRSSPLDQDDEDLYSGPPASRSNRPAVSRSSTVPSPSPTNSISSDKENRGSGRLAQTTRPESNKAMPPPARSIQNVVVSERAEKRRRLADRDGSPLTSQVRHERELEEVIDSQYYDPDQDMDERRAIRKGLRDLNRDLNDSRAEYLAAGSSGIVTTIQKANELFSSVKQTSDATLDSRLLVSAADLSYKKTAQLTLGDGAASIDVDDFVSKCIRFMRRGPGRRSDGTDNPPVPRQGRRNNGGSDDDEYGGDAEGLDETDVLDWEFFGRRACYPFSRRPAAAGFLLGPLSIQKRGRAATQRGQRQARRDPNDLIQPEELQLEDIEKVANSNLTVLCTGIRQCLVKAQVEGAARVEAAAAALGEDIAETSVKTLMEKERLGDDGGVQLYPFIVNPTSFGQTVENLFYVSFLIRDGSAGVGEDGDGLPTIHAARPRKIAEIKEQGVMKHQAIFSLDFHTWRELIRSFDITKGMIPHREGDDSSGGQSRQAVGASGWYA